MSFFAERRARLLAAMPANSVAVIPAAQEQIRNGDAHYPFRQNSDFYYLTGLNEPDAVLVLAKTDSNCSHLWLRPRDPLLEIWNGRRLGPEGAVSRLGIEKADALAELDAGILPYLDGRTQLYYPLAADDAFDKRVLGWLNQLRGRVRAGSTAPQQLADVRDLLHPLRQLKSAPEIAQMRFAAQVSAEAHVKAMQACQPGRFEYQLEAELHYHFGRNGCRFPAYGSIVAGGANACILHYTENDATLNDGELVLIDAGAEFEQYAADITRTFPVNGRFSPAQRQLYELVLAAQQAAFEQVRPGNRFEDYHLAAVRVLAQGLKDLGWLQGSLEQILEQGSYRRYYMHRTGHWLGMDVHDVGPYRDQTGSLPLQPGMVVTVEPGLYVAADDLQVPAEFRGIGIRIEDDLLVTETGHDNLTAAVPSSIAAIEALMATR